MVLQVDTAGRTTAPAAELLTANGPNALPEKAKPGWLRSWRSTAVTCRSSLLRRRWCRC